MVTIVEFLTARLDEDAARFDEVAEAEAESCRNDGMPDTTADEIKEYWLSLGEKTEWPRHLREVEAKRAIVALHTGDNDEPCQSWAGNYTYEPCATLKALASVYADHPDYDEKWKP